MNALPKAIITINLALVLAVFSLVGAADGSVVSGDHSKKRSKNLPHFPFVSYPIGFVSERSHLAPDDIWLPKGTKGVVRSTTYTSTLSVANTNKPEIRSHE